MDQRHGLLIPDLNPLYFYLWRHINSNVYATAVSDVQNLQQWAQNALYDTWGIFQPFNHCSEMQHPVLKLKIVTLSIFLNLHEDTGWKQCFRRPTFINYLFFSLYCSVDSLSTGLAKHFSCGLYSIPYKCGKVNTRQTNHLTESMVKKPLPHLTVPNK